MGATEELALDYVHITPDGLHGQTPDVLDDLYWEMVKTNTGLPMRDAIETIRRENSTSPAQTQNLLGQNTYLVALQEGAEATSDRVPSGVLYANGESDSNHPELEGFSVLRMGLWLRHDPEAAYSCDPRTRQLSRQAVDAVLHDVSAAPLPPGIHIPVNRNTGLEAFPSVDNAARLEAVGWTFGRRQIINAIDALTLPNDIRGLFMASIAAAHEVGDSGISIETNTARLLQLLASLTPRKIEELLDSPGSGHTA